MTNPFPDSLMSHFDLDERSRINTAVAGMNEGAYIRISIHHVWASVDGVVIVDRPTPYKILRERMLRDKDSFVDAVIALQKGYS